MQRANQPDDLDRISSVLAPMGKAPSLGTCGADSIAPAAVCNYFLRRSLHLSALCPCLKEAAVEATLQRIAPPPL